MERRVILLRRRLGLVQGCRSWYVGYFGDEDLTCLGGDAMGMAGAVSHNPEYSVGAVDQYQLGLFVEQAVFVVGEIVAKQLCAMCHAEGLETVASLPVA